MIRTRLYRHGEIVDEEFDPSRISDVLEDPDSRVWVDVEAPTDAELEVLRVEFDLHPLSIEDSRHQRQRPKVEFFESYFFVVIHGLALDRQNQLVDCELHVFAGKGFLVTLRYKPAFDLSGVEMRWSRQSGLTAEGGGFLLYALLDDAVDGYLSIVERYEEISDDIEDAVFADVPDPDIQEKIFLLKREITVFRRLVIPMREILDLVQDQPGFVTDKMHPYYRDVSDHVVRTLEFLDNIRDLLTSVLEALLSQEANRLNVAMKKITSWAAILLAPTLIAGIYGMNFDNLPELHWRFGYAGALGTMAAAAAVLYFVFRRKGWL